jgi:hypothetical protein
MVIILGYIPYFFKAIRIIALKKFQQAVLPVT